MAVSGPGFAVPVFAAAATDAWGAVQELRSRPEVRLVPTPRHASVLLVAGSIPEEHLDAVDRVHDQLPHPRTTVGWRTGSDAPAAVRRVADDGPDELIDAVVSAHLSLTSDPSASEPDLLPDRDPNEWRGVGPNGQGGEGMMGGTPYGRPMAMTGDDRDGLALDRLHLRLGPFADPLPAGLVLDTTLQGDVIQEASATRAGRAPAEDEWSDTARSRLRWLSHALHVQGLDPLAARAAALALRCGHGEDVAEGFTDLRRRIRRSALLWVLAGTGRTDDGGDARARWTRRLDDIAAMLGGGRPSDEPVVSLDDLGPLLEGRTLGDAITTVVSLDLDRPSAVISR